ncbi:dihydroxyacetone kinase subunit DhaL [Virgibacillus halophilus]|uniref:Dihydroxyacetone kinase subunit DhaL n=1 Tax=Tigheibacillus halophilus TaxID=361280 RepID=A0ABU5C294_9BACI|nr:dihydroxyacetone kinase subunit DhaL [Virgibacillus halophilus]
MEFSAGDFITYFQSVADLMEKQKDYLCELDRKLGDGDHGVTMSIGWQAVLAQLDSTLGEEADCGKLCIQVGKTFLNAVGSSVGPLYATALMRGGKILKGKVAVNEEQLYEFWCAFCHGVKERGQAEIGDKTMVDTLEPAREALEESWQQEQNFQRAFEAAVAAGETGMQSTIALTSKLGRSSRLGERSAGTQDPGATSAFLLLSSFSAYLDTKIANAS